MQYLVTIPILFFCSGFAALSFEIVWCRLLLRIFGSGSAALSCVFAAFMAGAGVGAFLAFKKRGLLMGLGKFCLSGPESGDGRAYLRAYGRLELLLAISGLALTLALADSNLSRLFSAAISGLSADGLIANLIRFFLCFALMFFPCVLMGAVYPVLSQAFIQSRARQGYFALLYGINTAGAAAGSLLAAFILVPGLGLSGTAILAAAVDVLIFLSVEVLAGRSASQFFLTDENPGTELRAPGSADSSDAKKMANIGLNEKGRVRLLASSVFLSGIIALVFQLCWARIFALVLGSSVYSSGTVLLMVLLGIGSASLIARFCSLDRSNVLRVLALLFLFFGISALLSCYFNELLFWLFLESSKQLSAFDPFLRAIWARLSMALVFICIPSFFIGAVLPIAVAGASPGRVDFGSRFYALNCFGAALACLIFNFFLFPSLERISAHALLAGLLFLVFLAFSAGAILLLCELSSLESGKGKVFSLAVLFLILTAPAFLNRGPQWDSGMMSSGFLLYHDAKTGNSKNDTLPLRFYDEGANCTVALTSNSAANCISLRSDGKVEATLPLNRTLISPSSDINTHVLLGALPVLFHEGMVENAFLVGLGSGVSASSILSFPEIKTLNVAEIEKAIVDACRLLAPYNGNPIGNGGSRLRLQTQDARYLLQSGKTTYDLIVSQPADPWVSGSSDLYTTEFFRIAASRLNETGIYCQWLQLYAIPEGTLLSLLDSFSEVFPRTYVCRSPGAGELILLGYKSEKHDLISKAAAQLEQADRRIQDYCKTSDLLAASGISNGSDALSLIIAGPQQLTSLIGDKKRPRHTDDCPLAEYETCRRVLTAESELDRNLEFLASSLKDSKMLLPFSSSQSIYMSRSYAKQVLQDASALRVLNEKRALAALDRSFDSTSPFYFWSKKLVMEALFQKEFSAELPAFKVSTAQDTYALFDMYFSGAETSKACRLINSLAKIEAGSDELSSRLAFCEYSRGSIQDAMQKFKGILEQSPCREDVLLGASYAAESADKYDLAEDYMRRYLSINPWDFESQLVYTDILCKQNRLQDALSHADTALLLRPDDASAHFLVLDRALSLHNTGVAATSLRRLQRCPADSRTRKVLIELEVGGAEKLPLSQGLVDIVKKIRAHVYESKKGYKIFGQL